MNIHEKLQSENFKNMLKTFVDNNPNLTSYQKEIMKNRIDNAVNDVEFITELMKRFNIRF